MKMVIENEKKVSNKAVEAIVSNDTLSKSARMKELFALGLEVKVIATLMNVRYNFVYNVVSNHANVNGIQTETSKKEVKKDLIVAMFEKGSTNKEISIELKVNYNYVHNVLKVYKQQKESAVQVETNDQTETA